MELFFRFVAVLFWIWKATVLGLSFILDKAILMAVSWWNLSNKLRWSRFDDAQKKTQTCKLVIAAKDGTNKKWGN